MERKGNCYQLAFIHLQENPERTLVHGIPRGQADLEGIRYGHAWIEFEVNGMKLVYDTTVDKVFTADFYYEVGDIKYTVRYSHEEAIRLALETKVYGPWDRKMKRAIHS